MSLITPSQALIKLLITFSLDAHSQSLVAQAHYYRMLAKTSVQIITISTWSCDVQLMSDTCTYEIELQTNGKNAKVLLVCMHSYVCTVYNN